jgi:putative AdoMet-dependent methyltransferase
MLPNDPFSPGEFDPWAETYDHDVASQSTFPFNGYDKALATVIEVAAPARGMSVLDIGTGTGNLALRFAQHGCELWCTDFSETMLSKAREKIPNAHFILHDLRAPWPAELDRRFDRIVSAYVFHHFDLKGKIEFCKELTSLHLAPDGKLVIADLSFPNLQAMEAFAKSVGPLWEQEPYWLEDESSKALAAAGLRSAYVQISACAGIYTINT